MSFGSKLQKLRRQNGLSQEELAQKCEVSRQAISKWEAGQSMPEIDKIILLAEMFGVSTGYLLRDIAEEKQIHNSFTISFEKICDMFLPGKESVNMLYKNADLYDVFYDEERDERIKNFWLHVLEGISIKRIHDCSIGTGQTTLALGMLGYEISGSDISQEMLKKCERNAKDRNISIELKACDFRELSKHYGREFDIVMSTSNSLPHVSRPDVKLTLLQMDRLLKPEGYIYLDTRNWDKILREHQRFYFYDPIYKNSQKIHMTQVWDYNLDGTITFNVLHTFEENGKIVREEVNSAYYYPIFRQEIEERICDMGYEIVREESLDAKTNDIDECDWYYILAKKAPLHE